MSDLLPAGSSSKARTIYMSVAVVLALALSFLIARPIVADIVAVVYALIATDLIYFLYKRLFNKVGILTFNPVLMGFIIVSVAGVHALVHWGMQL